MIHIYNRLIYIVPAHPLRLLEHLLTVLKLEQFRHM